MNDLATRKPITFGGDSKSARFRIDFFGQIYGKRQDTHPDATNRCNRIR